MDRHGEVVLRHRVCPTVGCHAVFWICPHCDRGQRYCSDACRFEARRGQRRRANDRHQRSPEGQLDHRDRQRRYRRRRARVTDQGSLSIISPTSCGCGTPEATSESTPVKALAAVRHRRPPERPPVPFLRCVKCGRKGRFVDPLPTIFRDAEEGTHDQPGNVRADSPLLLTPSTGKSALLPANSTSIPMPFATPSNRTASIVLSRCVPALRTLIWSSSVRYSISIRDCAPRAFIR